MTVIAWDGRALAADKRSVDNGTVRTVTKIHRHGRELIGAAGTTSSCTSTVRWYMDGAIAADYPACQKDKDDWCALVVITAEGKVHYYDKCPVPTVFEDSFAAWGSGRAEALASMYCGKTAREAVEVASIFDASCGNGVDELIL